MTEKMKLRRYTGDVSYYTLKQAIKQTEVDLKAGRGYGEFTDPKELARLRIRAVRLKAVGLPEEQFARVITETERVVKNGLEIEGEDIVGAYSRCRKKYL